VCRIAKRASCGIEPYYISMPHMPP
jgi:hypothetical protein